MADELIAEYFKVWKQDLSKTEKLLNQDEYYLEAILVLSCYVGALASLRYPQLKDNKSYKKTVLQYSGKKDIYEKIDLFFFYQWPKSDFKDHGSYKKLKNYNEIKSILVSEFGDEDVVKNNMRYVTQQDIIKRTLAKPFKGLDQQNLESNLPLFSVCEILYRYVRCYAVHNKSFPLVNKVFTTDGVTRYKDKHVITGEFLFQTVENILHNLEVECLKEEKWPHEL
jgi:hypothetical protein